MFSACNIEPIPTGIPPFYTETKAPHTATVEATSTLPINITTNARTTTAATPYPEPILQATGAYPYPVPLEHIVLPYATEPAGSPPGDRLDDLELITVRNSSELRQFGLINVYTDTARVISIDFSPDGNKIAFGNWDGNVYLFELRSGEVLYKLNAGMVEKLFFDPNGKYLVVGGGGQIFLLDLDTLKTRIIPAHLGANRGLRAIAISPDGKLIVSGGNDGRVRLWDVQTGELLNAWYELRGIDDMAFSPDGKMVVTAGGRIRLWDYEAGLAFKTIDCACDIINSIAFSPSGDILASGGRDYVLRLWEVKTGKELSELKGPNSWINSMAFSPDGSILVVGWVGELQFWQVEPLVLLRTIPGGVNSITFNPSGYILALPGGGKINLYGVLSPGE